MQRKTSKKIQEELSRIKGRKLHLAPKAVLAWANKNQKSAIWEGLEHDTKKGLVEFQLIQIKKMISGCYTKVECVGDTWKPHREYVSLPHDQVKGKGYREIHAVLSSDDLCLQLLQAAEDDADMFKDKYEMLHQVKAIVKAIDDFRGDDK